MHKYCNRWSSVLLLRIRLVPTSAESSEPTSGWWLTYRHMVISELLAWPASHSHKSSPWRNGVHQVSMLHCQVCWKHDILRNHPRVLKSFWPILLLTLGCARRGNATLGSIWEKMEKWKLIAVLWGKKKKSMVNHVIINHSFLRLITQLLVTSRATQQFF